MKKLYTAVSQRVISVKRIKIRDIFTKKKVGSLFSLPNITFGIFSLVALLLPLLTYFNFPFFKNGYLNETKFLLAFGVISFILAMRLVDVLFLRPVKNYGKSLALLMPYILFAVVAIAVTALNQSITESFFGLYPFRINSILSLFLFAEVMVISHSYSDDENKRNWLLMTFGLSAFISVILLATHSSWSSGEQIGIFYLLLVPFLVYTALGIKNMVGKTVCILSLIAILLSFGAPFSGQLFSQSTTAIPKSYFIDTFRAAPLSNKVFGFGLGNINYAFENYRPLSFNTSSYFNSSSGYPLSTTGSFFMDILLETGIFGVLIFAGMIIYFTGKIIRKKTNGAEGYFVFFILLYVGLGILRPFDLTSEIFMWTMVGLNYPLKPLPSDETAVTPARSLPYGYIALFCAGVVIFGYLYMRVYLGNLYYAQGIVAQSASSGAISPADFKKAVEQNPLIAEYHKELCLADAVSAINESSGQDPKALIDEAIKECDSAVKINPRNVDNWNTQARLFYNIGLNFSPYAAYKDRALTPAQKGVEVAKGDPLPYANLALLLSDAKKDTEAIAAYKEFITIKPDYFQAYMDLASLYETAGKYTEALSTLDKSKNYTQDQTQVDAKIKEIQDKMPK